MTQKINFSDVGIVIIERNYYRIHLSFMTRTEAVDKVKNTDLTEKDKQL